MSFGGSILTLLDIPLSHFTLLLMFGDCRFVAALKSPAVRLKSPVGLSKAISVREKVPVVR